MDLDADATQRLDMDGADEAAADYRGTDAAQGSLGQGPSSLTPSLARYASALGARGAHGNRRSKRFLVPICRCIGDK